MLTERAVHVLDIVLTFGCNGFKAFPYKWNRSTYQLEPASKSHLLIFSVHLWFNRIMALFAVVRLAVSARWDSPDRNRILHIVWTVSYGLSIICFIQFQTKKAEIMHFVNCLCKYINKERNQKIHPDIINVCVYIGGFLLAVNGPAHGTGMIEIPCTPHFVSSLVFPCRTVGEDTESIFAKLPFFLIETYTVTLVLFEYSFNWFIIFLGLAWIYSELGKIRSIMGTEPAICPSGTNQRLLTEASVMRMLETYRQVQRINLLLNSSFKWFLEWFPSILLSLVALLLAATIKLWYIPIHAYLLFPACALRCLFETMTPLSLAGKINEESKQILTKWKYLLKKEGSANEENVKWLKCFRRSCPVIDCTAGPLYTFENSIVLVTIHNCVQLTVNLLLMSNRERR